MALASAPLGLPANNLPFRLCQHWHNRTNWLFNHTPSGAHASAAIYSLIETAKINGLSPYEYLQFVFETLPTLGEDDDRGTLLPWRWQDTLPA